MRFGERINDDYSRGAINIDDLDLDGESPNYIRAIRPTLGGSPVYIVHSEPFTLAEAMLYWEESQK